MIDDELMMMDEESLSIIIIKEDAQLEHASTNFESRGCWTATVYASRRDTCRARARRWHDNLRFA